MGKWGAHGTHCACGKPEVARGLCWACYKRARWQALRDKLPPCDGRADGHHEWTTAGRCIACGAVKPRGWR